ncbi:hypothetical protein [Bartonella vinsonii]|uniref:Uncharacterized protein n=1 Tax=Bartonella vinsonii TaxID=33047 RepID=A0A448V637_BARVI|nr:hypothetical protein [Bartonella vinsonii]VEJ45240.1 Uncharacterised protein [Bartonella vinsonii]
MQENFANELANIKRELAALKKQSVLKKDLTEMIRNSLETLWTENIAQGLGPKMEVEIFDLNSKDLSPEGILIEFSIKNPIDRPMKMNYIRIDENSPFKFVEALYPALYPYSQSFSKDRLETSPKCIDLINPIAKNPVIQNEVFKKGIDLFTVNGGHRFRWELKIRPVETKDYDKLSIPIFILEHTSSYDPHSTLEVRFWPNFFRGLNHQR